MADEPRSGERATAQGPYLRGDGALDAIGQEHLARALRVSFILLAVVMILVLVFFVFSGTKIIKPHEKGIKTIFGRVVATVDQGLSMTWPFPIGDINVIEIQEQSLPVTEFWMYESKENVGKPMEKWRVESDGLRPGWDGALMTGDHNLIHVRLNCTLMIADPVAVMANLNDASTIQTAVWNVLSSAAIRSAATKTAEGLRKQQDVFVEEVKADAQRRLNVLTLDRRKVTDLESRLGQMLASLEQEKRDDAQDKLAKLMAMLRMGLRDNKTRNELLAAAAPTMREEVEGLLAAIFAEFDHDGVRINQVKVSGITWPIRALPAYKAAQDANTKKGEAENKARGDAVEILSKAAGQSYQKLIDVEKVLGTNAETQRGETQSKDEDDKDLIGQYARARDAGNEEQAAQIWSKIDDVLMSNETGGEAAKLISAADGSRTKIEQAVEARLAEFNKKIEGYEKAPQLTLDRLWADTRDRILSNPLIQKFYLTMGKDKTIVKIGGDPDAGKRMRDVLLKKKAEDEGGASQQNK